MGLHIVMVSGENKGDHIRSALEEEAKMDARPAFKEVFPESTNVHASMEMRMTEGFARRLHRFRYRFQFVIRASP
jgi:hypothetical protein